MQSRGAAVAEAIAEEREPNNAVQAQALRMLEALPAQETVTPKSEPQDPQPGRAANNPKQRHR